MSIAVGDALPDVQVQIMGEQGPENAQTSALMGQGRVVLFGVPGAFTPGCSKSHLPGFVAHADELKAQGVERIVCMSVNDAFVMHAWGEARNAGALLMLADGNADFSRALGLEMDASQWGMGVRCKRFALVIENGRVVHAAIEPAGGITVSSAPSILQWLQAHSM